MKMKIMRRYGKVMTMSAAALVMTAALTIQSASAYFTTYAEASGGEVVSLGATTKIEETVENKTKRVSVVNTSETNECFVRVKVFSGSQVTCTPSGSNWTYNASDEYWYYEPVVAPGGNTDILEVTITIKEEEKDNTDSFNVVVIQECTPVIYNSETGNPDLNASWKGYSDSDREGADS